MNLDLIIRRNAEAQLAFARMLAAGTLADPNAPEVLEYRAAERAMDEAIVDLQGLTAQRDLDHVMLTSEDVADMAVSA